MNDYNFATLSFNSGVLTAAPGSEFALLGDANHDSQVNTSDFTAMSQHFGQANAGWSDGDFNGDGRTNALDFNALATEFGANAQARGAGVARTRTCITGNARRRGVAPPSAQVIRPPTQYLVRRISGYAGAFGARSNP